jgi:hypothetical protein
MRVTQVAYRRAARYLLGLMVTEHPTIIRLSEWRFTQLAHTLSKAVVHWTHMVTSTLTLSIHPIHLGTWPRQMMTAPVVASFKSVWICNTDKHIFWLLQRSIIGGREGFRSEWSVLRRSAWVRTYPQQSWVSESKYILHCGKTIDIHCLEKLMQHPCHQNRVTFADYLRFWWAWVDILNLKHTLQYFINLKLAWIDNNLIRNLVGSYPAQSFNHSCNRFGEIGPVFVSLKVFLVKYLLLVPFRIESKNEFCDFSRYTIF